MIGLLFPKAPRVRNIPLAVYVSVLFALGTVFMAMNLNVAVLSFIDNRNFPGGPEVWAQAEAYKAIIVVPNTVFILANWMADALLVRSYLLVALSCTYAPYSSTVAKSCGTPTTGCLAFLA